MFLILICFYFIYGPELTNPSVCSNVSECMHAKRSVEVFMDTDCDDHPTDSCHSDLLKKKKPTVELSPNSLIQSFQWLTLIQYVVVVVASPL